MHWLAHIVTDRRGAWAIVLAVLVLALAALRPALQLRSDDDVLRFLPQGNADIERFNAIQQRFGGLDVALVGLHPAEVFAPDFLRRLSALTRELSETQGVADALSLANVDDFSVDPVAGGIITAPLVSPLPNDAASAAALRAKVMSREAVVGSLISPQGDAVLLLVFGAHGTPARALAHSVQTQVSQAFPELQPAWGGAPFVSTYVFDASQRDLRRLTPWAVVVVVVVILVSFRDPMGSALALGVTALGIELSRAAMALLDVPFNLVLSSMPVLLFALGSAYSIHLLSHTYAAMEELDDHRAAIRRALQRTGPVMLAAGGTTIAGLLSFLTMDIAPMRSFGLFTALGIGVSLLLSITLVPAVLSLWGVPRRVAGRGGWLARRTLALVQVVRARRGVVGSLLLLLALLGAGLVGRVDTRMDQAAFFSAGSPPDRAQRFLDQRFGGSQFLQIELEGDLTQPSVLRELRLLADEISLLPHVSRVDHIAQVIAAVNEAMVDSHRVPDTAAQVALLYRFLAGRAAVDRLVTPEHDAALLQVRIDSNQADVLERVLAQVEQLVAHRVVGRFEQAPASQAPGRLHTLIAARLRATLHAAGVAGSLPLALSTPVQPRSAAVAPGLARFLASEENFVPLSSAQAQRLAQEVSLLGPHPPALRLQAAVRASLDPQLRDGAEGDAMVDDLLLVLEGPLPALWARASAEARLDALLARSELSLPPGEPGVRLRARLVDALADASIDSLLLPSDDPQAQALRWTVSGLPVMYRGLSRSVAANQLRSLGVALALVWVLMSLVFRSPGVGLLATAPTALSLLLVYGSMGALGVHLDIGTSMLASLIIGAGVDYAVHLLAAFEGTDPEAGLAQAVAHTAPAIWTNAVMVALGFFVLTLGDARPLRIVGSLTAAAMLVAALATFLLIPLLARRGHYPIGLTASDGDRAPP